MHDAVTGACVVVVVACVVVVVVWVELLLGAALNKFGKNPKNGPSCDLRGTKIRTRHLKIIIWH